MKKIRKKTPTARQLLSMAVTASTTAAMVVAALPALAQQPSKHQQPSVQRLPPLPEKLANCSRVLDGLQRLACFDALATQFADQQVAQLPSQLLPATTPHPTVAPSLDAAVDADVKKTVASNNSIAAASVGQPPEPLGHTEHVKTKTTPGLLDRLYSLRLSDEKQWFKIVPHRDIYVLPVSYSSIPQYSISTPTQQTVDLRDNPAQGLEAAFQLSFKTKLLDLKDEDNARLHLWLGYTQLAHWQLYNGVQSRPFRNTNYEPELFVSVPLLASLPWNGRLRVAGAGLVHQSNGQSDPYSRSWNRVYVFAAAEWGRLSVQPRLWYRVEPGQSKDDNPDITDYMGHGDVRLAYRISDKSTVKGLLRYNLTKHKGAVQLAYSHKLKGDLGLYVRLHSGYGANLLEYNHKNHSVGIGLVFNDWMGF